MKVNFLLFITLSITMIACSDDEFNGAKDLCFVDVSTLQKELVIKGYPCYSEEMKNALPIIWNVSILNDECKNIPYFTLPLTTSMLGIHLSKYTDSRDGLQVLLDTTKSFSRSIKRRLLPVDFQLYKQDIDTLINLQLDSNRADMNLFHILNNSNHNILLETQDGVPMVIQEALDSNGIWQPIEYWWYAWCGNAYNDNILNPNTYITCGAIKYTGEYETQLRLKLKNQHRTIYSSPYKGKINPKQFSLTPKHRAMDDFKRNRLFFKSQPKVLSLNYW